MNTKVLFVLLFLCSCYNLVRLKATTWNRNKVGLKSNQTQILTPLILVPGDGGSQLEARLDKPEVPHYFCDKKTTYWFDLWLNLALLVPYVIDCWVDNMRLIYNNASRQTYNPPGVYLRVPGFGNTSSIEYVDPSQVRVSGYFNTLVSSFVSFGYQRGVNIRGAPYDFRKAPNELNNYFVQLKQLVEDTYTLNNNEKAIIICHSLGCPNMLYFFNLQSQEWKDKYIKSMVSLAGPWGGSVKALKAFASGDNFGVVVVRALTIRQDERTYPSLAYLLPSDRFWSNDEVLLQSSTRNYTVSDYKDFFQDMNYMTGYEMWLDVKNLIYNLTAPNIEIHCLHGVGIDTIHNLIYNKAFPDSQPRIFYGDGDGTVNARSLKGCLKWQGQQYQGVYYKNFTNVDHMLIMSDFRIIDYIKNIAIRYTS